jgi:hypothetical protein
MFALPWLETDESETECSIFEQLRRCAGLILQHHGTTGKLGVSPTGIDIPTSVTRPGEAVTATRLGHQDENPVSS